VSHRLLRLRLYVVLPNRRSATGLGFIARYELAIS